MRHVILSWLILASLFLTCPVFAQTSPATGTATCNFDEDKQLVLEYQRVPVNPKKPVALQIPYGKVWAPGGKPMTLFTNTPVQLGGPPLLSALTPCS